MSVVMWLPLLSVARPAAGPCGSATLLEARRVSESGTAAGSFLSVPEKTNGRIDWVRKGWVQVQERGIIITKII